MKTRQEILAHFEGMRQGIYLYAYMRDSVYYVGTTGRTLKEAIAETYKKEDEMLDRLCEDNNV